MGGEIRIKIIKKEKKEWEWSTPAPLLLVEANKSFPNAFYRCLRRWGRRGVGRLAVPAAIWHKMLMRKLRRREFSVIKGHAVQRVLFLLMFTVCRCGSFAADQDQSLSLDAYLKRLGYQSVKWKENTFCRPLVEAKLGNG